MKEIECCDSCIHMKRAKGYGLGVYDYWCKISNGQKSATHVCECYEPVEDKES